MQPIEIDGWGTATRWGSRPAPAPRAGYPIPVDPDGGGGGGTGSARRTLRVASPRMNGDDVRHVQRTLAGQGLSLDVDGWYGPQTADRVRQMQGWNQLDRDGIVGPQTWAVIDLYNR